MISEHWLSWSLLIGFLCYLGYTILIIKEERQSFLDSAKRISLKEYSLFYPSWWGIVEEKDTLLRWQRLDTRYEWEAKLQWEAGLNKDITIEEDFKNRIEELEIVFDFESCDILMPSDFKERSEVKAGKLEVVRVEGTATQHGTERRYLDAFLVRDRVNNNCLFATSLSSVLDGAIEGPYFEEMMLNFTWS